MHKKLSLQNKRKYLRLILWPIILIVFTTVGIPLLFFYYWFNADKVKQIVINQFNNQNYEVVINGGVEPRSWHGLSLFIADLTVLDKAHHKILHINTANCQLSWPDLIIGHYKIRRIALNGVTFYQTNVNKLNYANLLNYNSIAKSEFNNLMNLSVTNLNLVESEDQYIIRDANLSLYHLRSHPLLHLSFRLARSQADINISAAMSGIENNKIIIKKLSTTMVTPGFNLTFQSHGFYAYLSQELWIENTKGILTGKSYDGNLDIDTILLSSYGLTINNASANLTKGFGGYSQILNVNAYHIEMSDFSKIKADSISTRYQVSNLANKLNLNFEFSDSVLDRNLNLTNDSCNLSAKYVPNHDGKESGEEAFNAGMRGKCSFIESTGTAIFDLSGKVDNNPAQLFLSYQYSNIKPAIRIRGNFTDLDLSKLILNSQEDNLLPVYSDKTSLPFSWINWYDLNADLVFNQLEMSRVNLTNVKTSFEVKDGHLNLTNFRANAYGGSIGGTASISKIGESYNIAVQQQIGNMSLEKLFSNLFDVNAIQGSANLIINSTAKGVATYEDLHRRLNGEISLRVSDGGFNGVDFSLFLSPENLAAFKSGKAMATNFTQLKADFNFVNGVSQRSSIMFSSPTIVASGDGIINFADTKIDYKLKVSSMLPLNTQKIDSVSIPVEINGDLFNPKIYIQNMTLNSGAVRSTHSRITASKAGKSKRTKQEKGLKDKSVK